MIDNSSFSAMLRRDWNDGKWKSGWSVKLPGSRMS